MGGKTSESELNIPHLATHGVAGPPSVDPRVDRTRSSPHREDWGSSGSSYGEIDSHKELK